MVRLENRRQARRFPIATSLMFREHGASEWRQASTLNLSRSGVLFRADGPLPDPGHVIDFIVALPLNGITPSPQARCTGHVVRVAPGQLAGGSQAVAATIDDYILESGVQP